MKMHYIALWTLLGLLLALSVPAQNETVSQAASGVETSADVDQAPSHTTNAPSGVEDDARAQESPGVLSRVGHFFKGLRDIEAPKIFRPKTEEEQAAIEAERHRQARQIAQMEKEQVRRRNQLERKEALLSERRSRKAAYRLREVINLIDRDKRTVSKEIARHQKAMSTLREERLELAERLDGLRTVAGPDPEALIEAEEDVLYAAEQAVLHNLQVDRWELHLQLATEADRVETNVAALSLNPRPTVRAVVDKQRLKGQEEKLSRELSDTIRELNEHREEILAAIELLRDSCIQAEEEVRLLEEKYELTKDRQDRDRLSLASLRRKMLLRRVELLEEQAEVMRASSETAERLAELTRAHIEVLQEDYDNLMRRYWRSIMLPLSLIVILVLIDLIISRTILPLFYQRDRLFIARRLGRYITLLFIVIVIFTFFFEDLRPFATTLGIAGAALVIALQDLCSSFAGWFVIVASRKVRVGDRIQVDEHRGDVIDIQLLRTVILELNNWLNMDEPTGRVIVIPNSFIFKDKVINYSHVHPYVWNKIDILMTFESSAVEAEELLTRILEEETREQFEEAKNAARDMEHVYGVADTVYKPKISSIIADSGVLFQMVFVSHYRKVVATRNKLNRRIIKEIGARPDLEFAYPTQRHIPTAEPGGLEVNLTPKSEK